MRMRKQRGWPRPAALVGFLEAAYRLEPDGQTWLEEIVEASRLVWARDGWVHGAIYDATDVAAFRVTNQHILGGPDGAMALLARGLQRFTPTLVTRSLCFGVAPSCHKLAGPELAEMYAGMAALGYPDAIGINGMEPSRQGIFIGLWHADPGAPSLAEMNTYRRMAHHLGAAHRLRRWIRAPQAVESSFDRSGDAAAIRDARGRAPKATGAAKRTPPQDDLLEALQARDLARALRAESGEGWRGWRPLTGSRWTLIDRFEHGGHRYAVAREDQASIPGLSALSDRERQVVSYLAIGQSTKEMAYALGISDATVRVLLARAASKLGVKTRRDVLEHAEVRPLVPAKT